MHRLVVVVVVAATLAGCKPTSPTSSGPLDAPHTSVAAAPAASAPVDNAWHGTRLAAAPMLVRKKEIAVSPTVSLKSPDADLRGIDDQKVVLNQIVVIVLDYPLHDTWAFPVSPPSGGWTRAQLARAAANLYAYVYAEEGRTTTTSVGKAGDLENRNQTTGTFGICCHDLDDLVLEGMELGVDASGTWYLNLVVGS